LFTISFNPYQQVKKIFSLLILLFSTAQFVFGQLSVYSANSTNNTLQQIVTSLVGKGVTVSNITSNQPANSIVYGTFTEPSGQLGINSGLLMTTGTVFDALGPNNSPSKTAHIYPWLTDQDLYNIVHAPIYDACVIEFDITTSFTQISFNYIFGSEEYPEFVGSKYNDVFAFLISGPGINGVQNLALIPNTNTPVSINTVNQNTNSSYFINNGDGISSGGSLIQYDGYTVRLKAVANLVPCTTYHLKLAIANVSDDLYDSGVFIESGSLSGNGGLIVMGGLFNTNNLRVCSSQLPLPIQAGTQALSNYVWTKNGSVISTGNQTYNVTSAGLYVVKAYRDSSCYWTDSINISVDQDFTLTTSPDTGICQGGTAQLSAQVVGSSGYQYLWTPLTGLSSNTIPNPIATPANTTTYQVTVASGLCKHTASTTVTVYKPINLDVNGAFYGCKNAGIQLSASGAEEYSWSPGKYLNDSTVANPIATIDTNTTFTVKGYNPCFSAQASVLVYASNRPLVKAYKDTTICYGGTASLSSDYFGQYQYSWSPPKTLSDANNYTTNANPLTNQTYILTVNNNGCLKFDTVTVSVTEQIKPKIVLPIQVGQIPWTVKLRNLSTGATHYVWYVNGFDSTTIKEPTFTFTEENYYKIVLKAINDLGCFVNDTLNIEAYHLFIPNLITPNGDGKNDNFEITGLSNQFNIEIYNRWGERVYQKDHYRNEWTGEGLTDGIYYFFITDTVFNKNYKGWVELLR
jgi:gliding motility-associated-like protein